MVVGSTTYSLGETIHFDLIFDSFADATQDRSTSMTINKANESQTDFVGPNCTYGGEPYLETDTYFVIWNDSDPTPQFQGMGSCFEGSDVIGWIN